MTTGAHDPIAEAPAAIWYVRPPTGGQYGPARGDVIVQWLSEGRVSVSMILSSGSRRLDRLGKTPPSCFPHSMNRAESASAPAASPAVSTTVPLTTPRSSQRTATRYESKKRLDSNALAIGVLVGLGGLVRHSHTSSWSSS